MTERDPLPDPVRDFLDADPRIERCPADSTYAATVLDSVIAQECEDMLHAAGQGRWTKANTYSYDAARKSVEAWLLAHGWRIRAVPGAHAAAVDVMDTWLRDAPAPGPRIARSFGASRKARHDDKYPHPLARPRTDRELRALVLDNVRLVNLIRDALGLPVVDEVMPTDESLKRRSD